MLFSNYSLIILLRRGHLKKDYEEIIREKGLPNVGATVRSKK